MNVVRKLVYPIADAIWFKARNPLTNETGAIWTGPFDKADASRQSSALDTFNAAMMVTQR